MKKSVYHRWRVLFVTVALLIFFWGCGQESDISTRQTDEAVIISTENYSVEIQKEGFRYGFKQADGSEIAKPHPVSGLQISRSGEQLSNIESTKFIGNSKDQVSLLVTNTEGLEAVVTMWTLPNAVKLQVEPKEEGSYNIAARTRGLSPSYGLGDHAAFGGGERDRGVRASTDLTGIEMDPMRGYRMISNFVVFPKQGFAEVNIEPGDKIVRLNEQENVQGSRNVHSMPAMYYFIGLPKEIYQSFLDVRNKEGYPVYKPKYEWFGVGWEAFGALAWNTNSETVTQNIKEYLDLGFPLEWMVVGSGFWPRARDEMDEHGTPYNAETDSEEAKKLLATTSFGMWDEQLYPNPKEMIDNFHSLGLKFTIGLRTGFIPGGPFTNEGLENDYYIKDEAGEPKLFSVGFPESEVYIVDAENPDAVNWYVNLCQKWEDYGVDGYKEDLFGYPQTLPDDFVNPINEALMDKGVYVMGRNNYLGSPVDIHRYNDFNYNQPQDRGPINGLAYAYSGFPYVYPDIVGGTGLATGRFGDEPKEKLRIYLMRYAQYAALNPSMSFGYGPWNFDQETTQISLEAAMLHDRLQPYIYSNAVKAYESGFPHPMTPLPLAYPDDENVHGLADTTRRSYQWLIGESLLATPLYGDDYATAKTRDVYLPEGRWIEYNSGQVHEGPATLEDYPLPIGKDPLFVGGKGIVVEDIEGSLKARIYPITDQAEDIFYGPDGKSESRITIASPDWENLTVIDQSTGKEIAGSWNRHAYEFNLNLGHDYVID
ncbi:TIM-barrel domain-containing protein [Halalkalibaculum sp. DA3122]|uniref:TIM-barrel domain-containing protein n=1 Tax=Halalkalibaculum sp. DA3122 TaxID=3373607 RepID=UPI003753EB49